MAAPVKPMREAMPLVTAFIDDCRKAFGLEVVDPQIRAGMQGKPVFFAAEGGREIGARSAPAACSIGGDALFDSLRVVPKAGR